MSDNTSQIKFVQQRIATLEEKEAAVQQKLNGFSGWWNGTVATQLLYKEKEWLANEIKENTAEVKLLLAPPPPQPQPQPKPTPCVGQSS